MKVKLDEHLGEPEARLLRESGLEVSTVLSQDLSGTRDEVLIEVCRAEGRVLVTLDQDFASPLKYPPERFKGLIVLRPPAATTALKRLALETLLIHLKSDPDPVGALWIVEIGRVRIWKTATIPEAP